VCERRRRREKRDLADKLFAAGVVCESVENALSLVENGANSRVDFTLLVSGGGGVCVLCCVVQKWQRDVTFSGAVWSDIQLTLLLMM